MKFINKKARILNSMRDVKNCKCEFLDLSQNK